MMDIRARKYSEEQILTSCDKRSPACRSKRSTVNPSFDLIGFDQIEDALSVDTGEHAGNMFRYFVE